MKRVQCDFSIGFDNEIEDIEMYPDNHLSKRMIRNILNDCVSDHSLPVCERCTGSILYDSKNNEVIIKSKSCVEVGEDWDKDKWSKNDDIHFPNERIRI
jgi:hypothetical protein